MPAITDRTHHVLARGKNLACILRFARQHPVEVIRVEDSGYNAAVATGKYKVTFYFDPEGLAAECSVNFGDWRVLLDWLISRRTWIHLHRIRFMDAATFAAVHEHPRTKTLRDKGIIVCGFIPNHPSIV